MKLDSSWQKGLPFKVVAFNGPFNFKWQRQNEGWQYWHSSVVERS